MTTTTATRRENTRIVKSYGIKNNLHWCKRDLYQNLVDGARAMDLPGDPLDHITVRFDDLNDKARVTLRGPSCFSADYLLYMGATTKSGVNGMIGEKGEGLKVTALLLFRDFGMNVTFRSSNGEEAWSAKTIWEPVVIGATSEDALCFDIEFTPSGGEAYNEVVLEGSYAILKEFVDIEADDLFASSRNRWLQQPIGAGIYGRPDKETPGRIFLAGLDRGQDDRLEFIYRIDEKLPQDTDRERRTLSHECAVEAIYRCYSSPFCPTTVFTALIEKKMFFILSDYTYDPEVKAFKRLPDYPEIWRAAVSHYLKRFSYSAFALDTGWESTQLNRWGVQQVKDPKLAAILREEGIKPLEDWLDSLKRSIEVKITDGGKYAKRLSLIRDVFLSAGLDVPTIEIFKPTNEEDLKLLGVYTKDGTIRLNVGLFDDPFAKALSVVAHERAHRSGDKHSEEFHDAYEADMGRLLGADHPFPGEYLTLLRKNTLTWNRGVKAKDEDE